MPRWNQMLLQESGTYWFNPSSLESDSEFMLLGLVAGLAIYNGAQQRVYVNHCSLMGSPTRPCCPDIDVNRSES
jgi:hypothetical protein